jgi:hypothetical protein
MTLLVCLSGAVAPAFAQSCQHLDNPAFYENNHFLVRRVQVKSPLRILTAINRNLSEAEKRLPLQKDHPFSLKAFNEGMDRLRENLAAFDSDVNPLSRFNLVYPRIVSCREQDQPPSLEVVYWIFTSNADAFLTYTWEFDSDAIEHHAVSAARAQTGGSFAFKPLAGYNRTSQLFGGAQLEARAPGGIFDHMRLVASGSPAANKQEIDLAGTRAFQGNLLHKLEYRLGYRRFDAPAGANRLREGSLYAQLTGVTQPFGNHHFVLRYGASLAGGNQQTDLIEAANAARSLAASGYGQLQGYLGVTARTPHSAFAASYGLQTGTRGATMAVDFVKHIADIGYNHRWAFKDSDKSQFHKSFSLETQFTGGAIQTLGRLPVTERFFGGNVTPNFIAGDSWRIRSGPVIRSIPQNRLNASSSLGDIGATSFYSVNLTASYTVWGRSIIPRELTADEEFKQQLEGQRESLQNFIFTGRLNNLPAMRKLVEQVAPLEAEAAKLNALVEKLPPEDLDPVPDELTGAIDGLHAALQLLIVNHLGDKKTLPSKMQSMLLLLSEEDEEGVINSVKALSQALVNAQLTALSEQVESSKNALIREQTRLKEQFDRIDTTGIDRLAKEDARLVNSVLDSFLNEINLFSLSPVAIFDVAGVWPDRYGARFGIGGGMRINIVNFNLTIGYAANPNPRPREGHGAFFFSMDVTDLLR